MTLRRASASLGCFLLLLLVPLCVSAAPKDPCKHLQRNLDQQIDDVKIWQNDEMQSCATSFGTDSNQCRQLKQQHAQELRGLRSDRTDRMAGCRGVTRALVPTFTQDNTDHFLETYYRNRGLCVEQQQPHTNCYAEANQYLHIKHHHYHPHYSDAPSGSAKSASGYAEKPLAVSGQGRSDKGKKQDAGVNSRSGQEYSSQTAHRGPDRDNSSTRSSGHDSSPSHGSGRSDSTTTASSHHSHDSGGASNSGGSHASGGSDFHGSSSSAGSSSSGASHSSGGSGSSSGSSSSPASSSSSNSSVSSGASASSPASSPSHDSGGSRPK
jgi:hypothetical protein